MLAPPPDQPNRLSQALDQIRRGEGEMLLADLADAPPEGDGKRAHAALAAQLAETPDVPLAIRLQAADLAGQLRDPRIPVTVAQWQYEVERIPRQFGSQSWTQTAPPYWCYMPDGRYQIGGWGSSDTMALLELPPFWVARLAITAAQYAPFVARGYGADAEAWWEPLGWRWRLSERRTQPWEWDKALYNRSNQPVLGVTWHEATAYCRWLSAQLADMLPAGYIVRLPTEAEWEASASFDGTATRRRFPWGANPPTPDLAIYGQPRNGRPTPVGCFPAGAAACGALDLAGNIWELTTSRYAHYPERSQSAVKLSSNTHPSWRGGSWIDNESSLQCGSRGNHYVVFKSTVSYGFRIVLAPSLE
ncbi:MAG: SUMF1/EgtB/PvdO family nonheme iron enzyme [Chloroflexales bacterium]